MLRRISLLNTLALALVGLVAGAAQATPLLLTVDSGASSLDIDVEADAPVIGLIGGGATTIPSGTIELDIVDPFGPTPSVSAVDATLGLTDIHIDLYDGGFLGSIDIDSSGLVGSLAGGSVLGTPSGSTIDFDIAGWVLALDAGVISVSGSGIAGGFLDPNPTVLDASVDPFEFALPSTIVTATLTDLGGGLTGVDVVIPVAISTDIPDLGLPASIDLSGSIVLYGEFLSVPEPAVFVLAAFGLALTARRRRRAA